VKLYELTDVVFRRNVRFELRIEEFSLERGEKVALAGQNGSGKTTFLRLLSFLEKPGSWEKFDYKGRPFSVGADRGGMGFLRQQPYLFRSTVAQNLAYPLKLRRLPSQEVERRVGAMLALMELGHLASARSRDLSGGEQKRLALGRVLIAEPDLLLLDEPTAHLDAQSKSVIENVLKKSEATLLLTAHDLHFAFRVSDRVLNMRGGRIHPSLPENILEGKRSGNSLETNSGLSIVLPPNIDVEADEAMKVMIDPRNLVLSLEPLSSSMRNRFRGRVSSVREQGADVWLRIDCGERLIAIITRSSYEEMGINLHSNVVVSFGVNAVEIL
jgi:tungstate transport system ATP-binding protein